MRFDPRTKTVTLSLEEATLLKRAAWDGPDPSPEEMPILERLLQNIELAADADDCQHVDGYGSLFEEWTVRRYKDGRLTTRSESICRICGSKEPRAKRKT